MRCAIVHDWLVALGGAEVVLESLYELVQELVDERVDECGKDGELDLYVLFEWQKGLRGSPLAQVKIATSFLQKVPMIHKVYRHLAPLFPKAIQSLDLSDYELIVSSSYAVAKGIRKRKGQRHICYCHSPMRSIWDLRDFHLSRLSPIQKLFAKPFMEKMRKFDQQTAEGVDLFIANSTSVAKRIKRHYGRESQVIFPPVDVERFTLSKTSENYFITASRHVPYKRLDLLVEAFAQMPQERLIIAGDGFEKRKLEAQAGKNVHFVGFVPKEELADLLVKATAFIHVAEEDFGIAMAEAQASGVPIIAYGKGGSLDIVDTQEMGVLFGEQTCEGICSAVEEFRHREFDREKIANRGMRFSKEGFLEQMAQVLDGICPLK